MEETPSLRMRQIELMLQKEPNDTFLLYGLALELKKANESRRAIEQLDRVIGLDAGYCYAYFQKGQILESAGDVEGAKAVYRQGMAAATEKGDAHARKELETALHDIE